MTNVFDYLFWRGDLTFNSSPFNETDAVILSRFAYLPFELLSESFSKDNPLSIEKIADKMLKIENIEEKILQKNDYRLLTELAKARRFNGLVVTDFESRFDKETQTQFSALSVRLQKNLLLVCFRGTDNTLVGWKEDFNMGFVCPVPAQISAVRYLRRTAEKQSGEIITAGHSKGGNLAVYSAVKVDEKIKNRIKSVYNFDGPGFDEKLLLTDDYKQIRKKVTTFVPQSSVVGMLLFHEENYIIVHSENSGLTQHDIYSWNVERNRFLYLETVTNSSKFVDYTIKKWFADMDKSQREELVDAVYEIIQHTGFRPLHELKLNWFSSSKSMLQAFKDLDDSQKTLVTDAFRLLLKSTKDGFRGIKSDI